MSVPLPVVLFAAASCGRTPTGESGQTPGQNVVVTGATLSVGNTACAVKDGGLRCWGANDNGSLGIGSSDDFVSAVPVDTIPAGSGIVSVSMGAHAGCALTSSGDPYCWGIDTGNRPTKVPIGPLVALDLGNAACAIAADGTVYCSGCIDPNDGVHETITEQAKRVEGLPGPATAVSVGSNCFACTLVQGDVWCWGDNGDGELGPQAAGKATASAVRVTGLKTPVQAISAGGGFACVIDAVGGVSCWGGNTNGQLGAGSSTIQSSTPIAIQGLESGVVGLIAHGETPCALTAEGSILCWGLDVQGVAIQRVPTAVPGTPANIVELASPDGINVCVRTLEGHVFCWGQGVNGLLGNGSTTASAVAVPVTGL